MKKLIIIFTFWIIFFLTGCSNNQQELELLKEQNKLLKEQISEVVNTISNSWNLVNTWIEKPVLEKPLIKPKATVVKPVTPTISAKQEAINNAKKEKERCYKNNEWATAEAMKLCTQSRCPEAEIKWLKEGSAECDTEYEKDLRIINLEY